MSIGKPTLYASLSTTSAGESAQAVVTNAALAAGNLAVVGVYTNNSNGATVSSITDGTNSYTKAVSTQNGGFTDTEIWYVLNPSGVSSGATMTVALSTASGNISISIYAAQVTGMANANLALDKTGTGQASSTSVVTATTSSLSFPNELAVGVGGAFGTATSYSGASGFTNLVNSTFSGGQIGVSAFDYLIVNTSAALTYAPTFNTTATRLACCIATFPGQGGFLFDLSNPLR